MEVGTEISQKIRSAIKAKLIELGAYVDDELPDYIMVMVANKKSQDQMMSDLNLFLGKNTNTFAEWLHGLLSKLQTISVDSSSKGAVKEKKKTDTNKDKKEKKTKKSSKNNNSNSDNSQAKSKAAASSSSKASSSSSSRKSESTESKSDKVVESEQNNETSLNPLNKNVDIGIGDERSEESQSIVLVEEVEDVRQMLVTVTPTDELAAELETTEAKIEQSKVAQSGKASTSISQKEMCATGNTLTQRQRKRSASPVIERRVQSTSAPKKHKGLTSVVANVCKGDEEEEEYDPLCPAVGSVASVVKVTSRKSRVPPSLQANSITEEQSLEMEEITESETQSGSSTVRLDETASLHRIRAVLLDVLKQDGEDDIAIFCGSIASSLRKMNQRNLAIAKIRIQRILFDYESSLHTGTERTHASNVASNSHAKSDFLSSKQLDSPKSSSSDNNTNSSNLSNDKTNSDRVTFGPKGLSDIVKVSFKSRLHFESPSSILLQPSTTRSEDSVSSSRNDHPSPLSHHPSKTSNSAHGAPEIDSSSSFHSTKSRSDMQPSTSNNKSVDSSTQIISLDSLHQKRFSELDSSAKVSSLLKTRPLFQNVQNIVTGGGSNGDNSGTDSPKPISAEQLKVLAKNLKITVTNSRALKSCSNSNNDESSSEESEDETDSEDESDEGEEVNLSLKEADVSKEKTDTDMDALLVKDSDQVVTVAKESEMSTGQEPGIKPVQDSESSIS